MIFEATLESSELKVPSINITLLFLLYSALARDILAFCPPDNVTPISPVFVLSPLGKFSKSSLSWHAVIT
jgi:hypothetical protein